MKGSSRAQRYLLCLRREEAGEKATLSGLGMTHTILRLPDVKKRTGLSRSTIYLRIAVGAFPKPVALGGRAVGWVEAEVQQWIEKAIQTSRRSEA